jgi:hypothetical protein
MHLLTYCSARAGETGLSQSRFEKALGIQQV